MTLTRAQRANLRKLADYLESLPENYEHFEMTTFLDIEGEAAVHYARHNGGVAACGTVGCAVGHGPAAGVLFRPREIRTTDDGPEPDWDGYAGRFVQRFSPSFDWAFCAGWGWEDNHHWGAAARIRYLLEHGKPPAGFGSAALRWVDAYRPFDKRYAEVPA